MKGRPDRRQIFFFPKEHRMKKQEKMKWNLFIIYIILYVILDGIIVERRRHVRDLKCIKKEYNKKK